MPLTLTSQDHMRGSGHFTVRPPVEDYWRLYDGMEVLILPRRYGGLSLKVQEALGAGMVVVMSDVSPNREWPIIPIHATNGQWVDLPGGRIQMAHPDMNHLVEVLLEVKVNEDLRERQKEAARRWALDHSWDALLPLWREKLEAL